MMSAINMPKNTLDSVNRGCNIDEIIQALKLSIQRHLLYVRQQYQKYKPSITRKQIRLQYYESLTKSRPILEIK